MSSKGQKFPDYIVDDARRATGEFWKDRETQMGFLVGYDEWREGIPRVIHLVVVRNKKPLSGSYEVLKMYFPDGTYRGCYEIHGFTPDEFRNGTNGDIYEEEFLRRAKEEGLPVYRKSINMTDMLEFAKKIIAGV